MPFPGGNPDHAAPARDRISNRSGSTRRCSARGGSGEKKAELALVLRLLKRQQGTLSVAQQDRVEHRSAADLGSLGEDLLDFAHAADLDHWLQGARGG